jgi:hypothetical protein
VNCEQETKDILTGKELRTAAEKGLRVKYHRYHDDPSIPDKKWSGKMEKAKLGYYIADTDIDVEFLEDDESASFEGIDCWEMVFKVKGVEYK